MSKKEKGEFGYLKYKRSFNLLLTIIAFLIIAAVFVTGLIIFKSRNNYMTLVATVLVLPGAKIAVSYFILLPHKVCDKELYTSVEAAKGELSALYDVIVSNNKKPIGVCAMVISDNTIIALSHDKAPDKALFETSLKEFLKNSSKDTSNATSIFSKLFTEGFLFPLSTPATYVLSRSALNASFS